jgi:hypothetical protein
MIRSAPMAYLLQERVSSEGQEKEMIGISLLIYT